MTNHLALGETSEITAPAKAQWLNQTIKSSIQHVGRNRQQNRRRATYIKIAAILLSGTVTLLLGLQISGLEKLFKDVAFSVGAIVTLLNAIEPYFNFRALWVEHELALARLHRLQDELDYYLAGTKPEEIDTNVLNGIHSNYQEIWNNLSDSWIQQRRSGISSSI